MRKVLVALMAMLACMASRAQVENRALQLTAEGRVDCGILPELNDASSYTVQLWMKPAVWSGTVLECGNLNVSLSGTSAVDITDGNTAITVAAKGVGEWQQLTIVNNEGAVKVFVDNVQKATKSGFTSLATGSELTIGRQYEGVVDEVRVWNIALGNDYNYFWNNTLNEFNDLVPNLVCYYKMDHEEWTASLVDYKSIWAGGATNHHGVITGGEWVSANNAKLPYLINGAYTANERFYDRAIEREAYLLSNDIINLGIVSFPDGHLEYSSPCNHATLMGTATVQESGDESRGRVLLLDGNGWMESPGTTLAETKNYTVEGWIYIDEWVEGATIMRKGEMAGNNGFSITLGAEDGKWLLVKASGETYAFKCGAVSAGRGKPAVDVLPLGEWVYVGVSVNGSGTVAGTFTLTCGGSSVSASTAESQATGQYEILGAGGQAVVWGEGFKGKMDWLAVSNQNYNAGDMQSHAQRYMYPGFGIVVNSMPLQKASALYLFEDAENPGYDTHSQDEWLRIMRSAFDGYRGYQMRISVKSHDGWETTIANYNNRVRFATDLARLAEPYDGVELDLEWNYNTSWETYGQLIDLIREKLGPNKTFMVSCHNVTYKFVPKNRYDKVDGFTFQQYGPQPTHFTWNTFAQRAQDFMNYGFPKNKIYLSYATTTSTSNTGTAIKGVRGDGNVLSPVTDDDYTPSRDTDTWTINGQGTFTFMSPIQVYRRAQYVTDNQLQGIFYWDMGNDLTDYRHKYHYAKMASYGLNANVDRIVTDATPNHPTGIGVVRATNGEDGIYDLQGRRVAGTGNGLYIINGRKVVVPTR